MSEHVFPTAFNMPVGFSREEVVRCRECRWYEPNSLGGICYLPDGDGDYARWKVEPMGFCKWGKKLVDGMKEAVLDAKDA